MSVTVVGSIAFDAINTPFGERERALGGSAVHFSLAASYFTEVRPVGPVGDDFGEREYETLRRHGVVTDDIEHVEGGQTFFWSGKYEWDLNTAHTLDTQLNVFGDFEPKLSQASRDCDLLFLANIQPDLQRDVRGQCEAAQLAALDSMNFWIESARDSLVETISGVDMVLMNDAELRMLTEEPNLVKAARAVRAMGPRVVIAKQGEYGAALLTDDVFFALPAYPLENVVDPTGAGDTFAGGFFALPAYPLETVRDPTGAGDSFAGGLMGYLDSQEGAVDDATLRRAMAYGSTLASFWVEEFGCERAQNLTREEIDERYEQFKRITAIDSVPTTG